MKIKFAATAPIYVKNKLRFFKRFIKPSDNRISNTSRPVELDFVLAHLNTSDVFFDIGSNLGLWSYHISKSDLKISVVAFEANPAICAEFERNLAGIPDVRLNNVGRIFVSKRLNLFPIIYGFPPST